MHEQKVLISLHMVCIRHSRYIWIGMANLNELNMFVMPEGEPCQKIMNPASFHNKICSDACMTLSRSIWQFSRDLFRGWRPRGLAKIYIMILTSSIMSQ